MEEKSMCSTLFAESLKHTHKIDMGNVEEIILLMLLMLATFAQSFSFRIYWAVAGRLKLLNKPGKLELCGVFTCGLFFPCQISREL